MEYALGFLLGAGVYHLIFLRVRKLMDETIVSLIDIVGQHDPSAKKELMSAYLRGE